MGWFWGDKNDTVQKLEPGLRDYLEQEKPDKYVPGPNVKPASTPHSIPRPPCRYAISGTYKPIELDEQSGVRGASRVIEKYKERGDTVQRAAMENCALEHEALTHCFKTGNWRKQIEARLTMCSAENGTFSRCFTTQTKFLQALGYAAGFEYDADKEERIQMHADKLYHQMLDYEKRVEDAKAAGIEPPPLTSLFNPEKPTQTPEVGLEIPGGEVIPEELKPSKPLQKLTPHERELEIRAHYAQREQHKMYAHEAAPFMKTQVDARQKRQDKAVSWFGETLGKWIS
ncbi:hypothetical protein PDIDSM_6480 [Penicillium digitatum]|nr:hypothetical protein PDIDSM_6480 [Penicillium digitatum]